MHVMYECVLNAGICYTDFLAS